MKHKKTAILTTLALAVTLLITTKSHETTQLFEQNVEALTACEITGLVYGSFTVEFDSACNWTCRAGGTSNCPI